MRPRPRPLPNVNVHPFLRCELCHIALTWLTIMLKPRSGSAPLHNDHIFLVTMWRSSRSRYSYFPELSLYTGFASHGASRRPMDKLSSMHRFQKSDCTHRSFCAGSIATTMICSSSIMRWCTGSSRPLPTTVRITLSDMALAACRSVWALQRAQRAQLSHMSDAA